MKKVISILIVIMLFITGCNSTKEDIKNEEKINKVTEDNKSLVLYFSATNTTEKVAKKISEVTNSDIVEIIPKDEYTSADLSYNNDNCRANKEQNDKNSRPGIKNNINIEQYDTIYLGYPIWWGTNPRIILTLLDKYNFENKRVILFCTSGGSGIEQSINDLKKYNNKINVVDGKRFNSSVSNDEINNWINNIKEK